MRRSPHATRCSRQRRSRPSHPRPDRSTGTAPAALVGSARPDARSRARPHVLPIAGPPRKSPDVLDAKDPAAKFSLIEPLRPPEGAPNVLIVLLDDVGFGAGSAFGGPCETPTAERLAGNGLRYNRFHTTALRASTRAALLTGRNHHTVGMGVITELATSAPGYNSVRPNTCAPLAQILQL